MQGTIQWQRGHVEDTFTLCKFTRFTQHNQEWVHDERQHVDSDINSIWIHYLYIKILTVTKLEEYMSSNLFERVICCLNSTVMYKTSLLALELASVS